MSQPFIGPRSMLEMLGQVELKLFGAEQSLLSLEEKMPFVPTPTPSPPTQRYTAFLLTKAYPSSLISKW